MLNRIARFGGQSGVNKKINIHVYSASYNALAAGD